MGKYSVGSDGTIFEINDDGSIHRLGQIRTFEECTLYLRQHPNGPFAEYAKSLLEKLQAEANKQECDFYHSCKTVKDFESYIRKYTKGRFLSEANSKIENLLWTYGKTSIRGCRNYISKYPNGIYIKDAKELLEKYINKRNKIFIVSLCVALCIAIVVCYVNWKPVKNLDYTFKTDTISRWGEVASLSITTNVAADEICIDADDDWVNIDTHNSTTTSVSIAKNGGDCRETAIVVTAYSTIFGKRYSHTTKRVPIKQASGNATKLEISQKNFTFDKYGKPVTSTLFKVQCNGVNLGFYPSDSWISVTHDSLVEGADYNISANINIGYNPTAERSAYIEVKSGDMSEIIYIIQESGLASFIDAEKEKMLLGEEEVTDGTYYPCNVKTDGTIWSVYDYPTWLLNVVADIENGKLKIETRENTGDIKNGTITIKSNNNHYDYIKIIQKGNPTEIEASPSSFSVSTSGGSKYINIDNDSYMSLSASENYDWLSATVISDSRIKIYYDSNNSSPRKGTVIIKCGDKNCTITVKQDGWTNCWHCGGHGRFQCNYPALWGAGGIHYVQEFVMNYYTGGGYYAQNPCPNCGGSGVIQCNHCNGSGRIKSSY